MKHLVKAQLSKIKFFLGKNPKIIKNLNYRQFIPEPYRSVLLISADFELGWAWRYSKGVSNPYKLAIEKAKLERENVPIILELCDKYGIPITWATVGHLFLNSCLRENGVAHGNLTQLKQFENKFWRFDSNDWFGNDPCTSAIKNPEWYCPDLIDLILNSKTPHEIGCHTFSHIDCSDSICPPEVMRMELKECKKVAAERSLELKSFVHPGHTIGNMNTLFEEGFTNFRTDYENILGFPKKHNNGIWELKQTAEFVYRDGWSSRYHIKRYISILKRAVKSNTVCVFWFHPSFDKKFLNEVLPEIFKFVNNNRDIVWVTTHNEYFEWLENNIKNSQ